MELNQHKHQELAKQHGATSSITEQRLDIESAHTKPENIPQHGEGSVAYQNGENDPQKSREPVHQTENHSTLDKAAHDIQGVSGHHEAHESIQSISRVGHVDLFLGVILGSIAGPLSLLTVKCWHGMAQHEVRRAKFLLGCSVGIIFQIIGLAIAFSVYKLSSRRT